MKRLRHSDVPSNDIASHSFQLLRSKVFVRAIKTRPLVKLRERGICILSRTWAGDRRGGGRNLPFLRDRFSFEKSIHRVAVIPGISWNSVQRGGRSVRKTEREHIHKGLGKKGGLVCRANGSAVIGCRWLMQWNSSSPSPYDPFRICVPLHRNAFSITPSSPCLSSGEVRAIFARKWPHRSPDPCLATETDVCFPVNRTHPSILHAFNYRISIVTYQ